jgi:hypothetical protein
MSKPQITTHYIDGTPSETRDMTDEEIAQLPTEPLEHYAQITDPSPTDV